MSNITTGLKPSSMRKKDGWAAFARQVDAGYRRFWANRVPLVKVGRPKQAVNLVQSRTKELAVTFIAMGDQPRGALTKLAKEHGMTPEALRSAVNRERERRGLAKIRNTLTT